MSEQPAEAPYPEILVGPRPWPVLWRVVWAVTGTLLVASFFLPLYKVLTANVSGIQLIDYLFQKDMEQIANLIGEFTTFLMYTAPLLAIATGTWVAVQGFRAILQDRQVRWVGSSALGASAFIVFLVCQAKLETPGGAFFFGKFMPKPAWGFYLDMALLLGLVICGAIFALLSRQPQPLQDGRA